MAYATPEDLDALVQGEIPAATATLLLDLASAEVDRETHRGQALTIAERTETLDGSGNATLWLDWPITAVNSVTVDGELLVVEDDYTWSRSGWLTRIGCDWSSDEQSIEVVYSVGFATGSPELLIAKRITLEIASRVAANPQALKSFTADGVTATFGDHGLGLSDEQKDDLAPLKSRRRRA